LAIITTEVKTGLFANSERVKGRGQDFTR